MRKLATLRVGGEWTCPMHPDIVCDSPRNCPICGMTLEPRVVTGEEETNPLRLRNARI